MGMRGEIRTLLSSSFFSCFYFFAHLLLFPTEQNGISVNSFHRFLYIIRKMNPLFEKDVFIRWHHYSFPIYINSINQKNPYIPLILFFSVKNSHWLFLCMVILWTNIHSKSEMATRTFGITENTWHLFQESQEKNWTLWFFNMMQPRGRDMKWS